MQITKDDYTAMFDNNLSEYAELYLRHARIYVETTAISDDLNPNTLYATRICTLESDFIYTILEAKDLSLNDAIGFEFYEHKSAAEVRDLYAQIVQRYMLDTSV